MATNGVNLLKLVSASVFAANQAGKIIRDIMRRGDLAIVEKGVNDLQTEADRSAQRCIVSSLLKTFPTVTVIGEEGPLEPSDKPEDELWGFDDNVLKIKCPDGLSSVTEDEIVVWVDPLDGTSEFVSGLLDHVTVLIGVAVAGKAIGGVIHQPYYNYQTEKDVSQLGRTIWALNGAGVHGIIPTKAADGEFIVATTRSHGNKVINSAVESVNPTNVLRVGGAGHKVLLVIEGKAHAYVFASGGCKKWDTCAPEAVLHAAGGRLTDILGKDLMYHKEVDYVNRTGVLATCDQLTHDKCLREIPAEVKASLLDAAFPSSSL